MKSAILIGLCLYLAASVGDGHKVRDRFGWAQEEVQDTATIANTSPVGYIVHRTSGKVVHPYGGREKPGDNTGLVVYTGGLGQRRLQFRFVPAPGFGHFGYIQHVTGGKYAVPYGGWDVPRDDTGIVLWWKPNYSSLFAFDEANEHIKHISGKVWHPYRGWSTPRDDTKVVLHHETAPLHNRFYFSDSSGRKISPYPKPVLKGSWKIFKSFINPKADRTYTLEFTRGKSQTKSKTTRQGWSISASFAIGLFSASTELSGFVEVTTEDTWREEQKITKTYHVKAGKTVVIWQYVYEMDQYDEQYIFKSNIEADTHSLKRKPSLEDYIARLK